MDKGNNLYAAYGFYLNHAEMADRCPTAQSIGIGELKDYRLIFRGPNAEALATVEPRKGEAVPVLVWEITPADEAALDARAGFPTLYRKETIKVKLDGRTVSAMVYVMNNGDGTRPPAQPGAYYFASIYNGYKESLLDTAILYKALKEPIEPEPAPEPQP